MPRRARASFSATRITCTCARAKTSSAAKAGLHRFIGWDGAILTDSGGYQVFSLEGRRRITDAGVHFQSHLDGSARFLSPESAVDIQAALGSDIAMVFDECLAYPAEPAAVAASVDLTLRWARRGRARMLALRAGADSPGPDGTVLPPATLVTPGQAQFGIVQGGVIPDLREASAAGHGRRRLRGLRHRRPQRRRAQSH